MTKATGGLVHFDPETGETSAIPVKAERVHAGAGEVWAALPVEGTVWRIDPSNKTVTDILQLGPNPAGIQIDQSYVWVLVQTPEDQMRLMRISRSSRTIEKDSLPMPIGSGNVSIGHGAVWVPLYGRSLDNGTGEIVAIDPETNELLGDPIVVGSGPTDVDADSQAVWVTNFNDNTISRITFEE